ncbi:MAG: NUDIX hydrolase [Nanoarchaeota archaeon]|nr:NUDIX hydrolase [Nanoarchaeota archaeon]MBU1028492.1 NUDIX hydrolase [Nanoarchaeota archaeon]
MKPTGKSAVCIIENNKGESLLQKKTMTYRKWPGVWTFFGGIVNPGESIEKAMSRELKEEIGVKLKVKFLFKFDFDSEVHVFYGKLNDVSKISLGEGCGFAFFDRKEFNKVTRGNKFVKEIIKRFDKGR